MITRFFQYWMYRFWKLFYWPVVKPIEKNSILQGQVLSKINGGQDHIYSLKDVEFSVFSQWGEDGIIDWLISKIPDIPRIFIEFGVSDYLQANTLFLLQNQNWRGVIIDGSESNMDKVRWRDIYWRHDLTALCAFINRDNIEHLIGKGGLSGEIGILSIDIDGNDYWVWEAINNIQPYIVICEYNAIFGDLEKITIPYQEDFQRSRAHYSNLFFGASLPALISLGEKKGYSFIGTCSNGCNAFFVRDDKAKIVKDSIKEIVSYPSLSREARNKKRKLIFASRDERIQMIHHMSVYDLNKDKHTALNQFKELYSDEWKKVSHRNHR